MTMDVWSVDRMSVLTVKRFPWCSAVVVTLCIYCAWALAVAAWPSGARAHTGAYSAENAPATVRSASTKTHSHSRRMHCSAADFLNLTAEQNNKMGYVSMARVKILKKKRKKSSICKYYENLHKKAC